MLVLIFEVGSAWPTRCSQSASKNIKEENNNTKLEKKSISSFSNFYRIYAQNNRKRQNNRYNLRTTTTTAVCNEYKGDRSELYDVSSKKTKGNASCSKTNIGKGIYTCGCCSKKFDDWAVHIVKSSLCSKYNTKCSFCNKFFRGIDGLNDHLTFKYKVGKIKIDMKNCAFVSWISSKLQPKVSISPPSSNYGTVLSALDIDDNNDNDAEYEDIDNDRDEHGYVDRGSSIEEIIEDDYTNERTNENDDELKEYNKERQEDSGGSGNDDDSGDDDDINDNSNGNDGNDNGDDGRDDSNEENNDNDRDNEINREDENDNEDEIDNNNDDNDDHNGEDNRDDDDTDEDNSIDNDNEDLGNNVHSRKCSQFGCKTCPIFEAFTAVVSPVTNIESPTINSDFPTFMDCNSSNVVYLLICNNCNCMYVGQTGRWLKIRIGEHFKSIRLGKGGSPFLVKHFSTGPCKGSKFSVCILEKLPGNGFGVDGKVDKNISILRRKKETEWMLRLRTVYPYGMNHDVGKNLEQGDLVVGTLFPKISKRKRSTSHSRGFRPHPVFNLTDFNLFINNTLENDLKHAAYKFRTAISCLKKCHLKTVYTHFISCKNNVFKQWYKVIIDLIETKLYKPLPPKVKRKAPKYQLKCLFANKAFDFINLPKILRTKTIRDCMPQEVNDDEIPMLVFKLMEPIRSKIMNYSKFVSTLDIDQVSLDITSVPCNCACYDLKFFNPHFNHVLTGDLDIIENCKLRNIILKGPKYREPEQINFWGIRDQIDDCLTQYIEQISKAKKIADHRFLVWKTEVLKLIDKRIEDVSKRFQPREVSKVLEDPNVKRNLKNLQKSFVFCPTDKAGNNVAVICKRLYAENILKEIDLANINNNSVPNTYCRVDEREADIVERHCLFQSKFSLDVEDDMRKLPPFHWTPKMHKLPTGARYIIGSKMSSLKPLGKALTKIFKVIFHHKRRFCLKAGFFSGLKQFWCIDNHNEVLNTLDRLNKKRGARSIATYDFSTLYTTIPHNKLIDVLSKIVDSVFNDSTRIYICEGKKTAYWVKGNSSKNMYTGKDVKDCLTFLINNAYFRIGKTIFRQKVGIPIGSDPAPFFANMFLFYYESEWIKKMSRIDFARARRLFNTFRYIDDLNALNDQGEFGRSAKEIYPPELVVNWENKNYTSGSFLPLWISIDADKRFVYKLYDKRDAFPFYIVRFPYYSSNIPSKMFFNTITAEILRICRASAMYSSFCDSCDPFMKRMRKQGAKRCKVKISLNKLLGRHFNDFSKFGVTKDALINTIIEYME